VALVLSGGGAKGAYQVGAEKYAREVKGYHWDVIAGVSVGALNASLLAMEAYDRLYDVWSTLSNDQVYTGGITSLFVAKVALGARSFYDNAPLWDLIQREIRPSQMKAKLKVGTVSLTTGEYVEYTNDDPNLCQAILASTVMPIIWAPVDVSPDQPSLVDGGVRNVSPVGDVLDENPDEIVIINCQPPQAEKLEAPPSSITHIGLRTLEIMLNQLLRSALREFTKLNAIVREAASKGIVLHGLQGEALKYYDTKIIEPQTPLGDTLDFSQAAIQHSLRAGWEQAQRVLG
jgi:NTE family protein